MYRLEQSDYKKVKALFSSLSEFHFSAKGMLDGSMCGVVYVDDIDNPISAYMYVTSWHFLAGKADNEDFNQALHELIMSPEFREATPRTMSGELFLTCDCDEWYPQFGVIFDDQELEYIKRRHYVFDQTSFSSKSAVPDGFEIRKIR